MNYEPINIEQEEELEMVTDLYENSLVDYVLEQEAIQQLKGGEI